jgi:type II secretory pathway predicted ATPase ExeA
MNFLHRLATATLRESRMSWSSIPRDGTGISDAMAAVYLDDMHGVRARAEEVFMSGRRLLIIGPPGAGKTTLLRARARALAEAFLESDGHLGGSACVPLYLSAMHLRGNFRSPRSIVESLADHCESRLSVETKSTMGPLDSQPVATSLQTESSRRWTTSDEKCHPRPHYRSAA